MKPGTKPKPTLVKKMSGNPGRRPLNEAEPRYETRKFYAPKHLNEDGKRCWHAVMGSAGRAGVVTEADLLALELTCATYEDWCWARSEFKKTGLVVDGSSGSEIGNPRQRIMKGQMADLRWFIAEFGLTPSSRTRIKADQVEERSLAEILFEDVDA